MIPNLHTKTNVVTFSPKLQSSAQRFERPYFCSLLDPHLFLQNWYCYLTCLAKIIEEEIQAGGHDHFYLETYDNLVRTTDVLDEAPMFHPTAINSETSLQQPETDLKTEAAADDFPKIPF